MWTVYREVMGRVVNNKWKEFGRKNLWYNKVVIGTFFWKT
jgi:hypothetical protein